MEVQLLREEVQVSRRRVSALQAAGVVPPRSRRLTVPGPNSGAYSIDGEAVRAISELVVRTGMSLADTVRLWRGETTQDPRPNKALHVQHLRGLLDDYVHKETVFATILEGVRHEFAVPDPNLSNGTRYANHASAVVMANALVRSIREGQEAGTYLVVRGDAVRHWTCLKFSPFGCVEKAGLDPRFEARVIHNLSFPVGSSTNDMSNKDALPQLIYEHVRSLAHRIERLNLLHPGTPIMMMRGDVKSAFRHLFGHVSVCPFFVGYLPEDDLVVIDLALPFGWTGSPAHYGAFGSAISYLVRRESPASLRPGNDDSAPFYCYEWVDDHVLVEPATPGRLELCESALRLAMLAVLGPRAINEKKFTPWSTQSHALGLDWDTVARTVSMPTAKIEKAADRVEDLLRHRTVTRSVLNKLLGSLRHVCSCIRPAKAFFQRLVQLQRRCPRVGSITITPDARLDLLWFQYILRHGRLRSVPLTMFADLPEPHVDIYMDASDAGLCVLDPASKRFIRIEFDQEEQALIRSHSLTINVREQFSAVLALLCWGRDWVSSEPSSFPHIRFWIDNRSAVSWCNSLSSQAACAQELNRVIGAVEASHGLRVSAEHLPGSTNTLADLGSRAWTDPRTHSYSEDLLANLIALQQRSLADSSRKQYNSTWRQWEEFCTSIGASPWLPRDRPDIQSLFLALFAVHCWRGHGTRRGIAPRSVLSKISHVRWHHRASSGFDPIIQPNHELALQGMRRSSAPPRARSAFTHGMLAWLVERLDPRVAQHRLIGGAAALGFFFLLRSSEYLSVRGNIRRYTLQVQDVEVFDAAGHPAISLIQAASVTVHFRGSKTDQDGSGMSRSLSLSGHPTVCPVRAAVFLLHHASNIGLQHDDPICSVAPGRPLKAELMAKFIRAAAAGKGSPEDNFSCHSLRSGGATALLAAGVDSTIVMLHGRWRSDVFQRYTRLTKGTSTALARRMTQAAV